MGDGGMYHGRYILDDLDGAEGTVFPTRGFYHTFYSKTTEQMELGLSQPSIPPPSPRCKSWECERLRPTLVMEGWWVHPKRSTPVPDTQASREVAAVVL